MKKYLSFLALLFAILLAGSANNAFAQVEKSMAQLKTEASKNNAAAQNSLGEKFLDEDNSEFDVSKAFYWFQKSAQNNNKLGQYNLAIMYDKGLGVGEDTDKYLYWLQKAAENNLALAQFEIAKQVYEFDTKKALYWYQKAAANGFEDSYSILGFMYELGEGTQVDQIKAFNWYNKAAAVVNDQHSWYDLGRMYEKGIGTTVNKEMAFSLYQKAASDENFTSAILALAKMYETGSGTSQNLQQAFYWCNLLAEKHDQLACVELGRMYKDGIGTEADLYKSTYWISMAGYNTDVAKLNMCNQMQEDANKMATEINRRNTAHRNYLDGEFARWKRHERDNAEELKEILNDPKSSYAWKKEKKEEYRKYTLNFNRAEEGNKREEDNIQQLLNEFNRLNQRIKIECK